MLRAIRVVVALSAVACAACGGAPAESEWPAKPPSPREKFGAWMSGTATHGDVTIDFGFENETPPPGFVRSTPEPKERTDAPSSSVVAKTGAVMTLIPLDEIGPVGRIEHFDASAPIYLNKSNEAGFDAVFFVPLVGPAGEKLSRAYGFRRRGGTANTPANRAKIQALGPVPLPRVTRFVVEGTAGKNPAFVYATIVGSEDGKPLYMPVTTNGTLVQPPPGVVGAQVLGTAPTKDAAAVFSRWLVRWKGERGEGWSLIGLQEPLFRGLDPSGPQWKRVTERDVPMGVAIVGERPNGHCDASVYRSFDPGLLMGWASDHANCDLALSTVINVQNKLIADKKIERGAREAALKAQEEKERAEKERDKQAALAADAKYKEEKRKKEAAEALVLTRYAALVKEGKMTEACTAARQGLSEDTHADLVVRRSELSNFAMSEFWCVHERVQGKNTDSNAKLARAMATRTNRLNPDTGSGPSTPSRTGDASGQSQSHEDYMKRANDYTYGSGKASSCPYSDRSLCR